MKVLVLTTKTIWYNAIRDNRAYEEIPCLEIDKILKSLDKSIWDVFRMDSAFPFRCKFVNDSYIYVMPCIFNDENFIALQMLKDRHDLIGAYVQDVLSDIERINSSAQCEITLMAHDKDLFDLERSGERFFDKESDCIENSRLSTVLNKLYQIYGYIHKSEPKARRVFPIIKKKLAINNLEEDIIQLFIEKIDLIKSQNRF